MDYYKALAQQAERIAVTPSETSYFSKPSTGLDPRLFRNGALIEKVRNGILGKLLNYLATEYYNPEVWTHAWLAGSGVSFQWAAHRDPADLDCLVGVDYVKFREANKFLAGLSDREIVSAINEGFARELNTDEPYLGEFELTFYVNIAPDIRDIKPYAAYSLTDDAWVTLPEVSEPPHEPEWEALAQADLSKAVDLVHRYSQTLEHLSQATSDAVRRNHETSLGLIVQQGAALYDNIHGGRKAAFSPVGQGYFDWHNYRWQAGKRSGAVQALKAFHRLAKDTKAKYDLESYGVELPDANTLIRRAASQPRPNY